MHVCQSYRTSCNRVMCLNPCRTAPPKRDETPHHCRVATVTTRWHSSPPPLAQSHYCTTVTTPHQPRSAPLVVSSMLDAEPPPNGPRRLTSLRSTRERLGRQGPQGHLARRDHVHFCGAAVVRHAPATDASMMARDLASSVSPKRGRVLCYYTNWVQYRSRGYAFVPESINPMLFTNIAYRLHSQPLAPPGLKCTTWPPPACTPTLVTSGFP
jgi:hypothetical protein